MTTSIDVTEVRRALMSLARDAYEQERPFAAELFGPGKPEPGVPAELHSARYAAMQGLAGTEVFTTALAAVLRRANDLNPEIAQELAGVAQMAIDTGIDWTGDMNADLDEDATAGTVI